MTRAEPNSGSQPKFGLRAKIVIRFAGLALLLSVMLGSITYVAVRQLLVEDRETNAAAQAFADATFISASLRSGLPNPGDLLISMRPPARSTPLLFRNGEWFAASLQVRPEDLPTALTELVFSGQSARQTIWMRDRPVSIVGVGLPEDLGSYFEVFSLTDVADALNTILGVLIVAGAVSTAAGAALGWVIAGRVLMPLTDVTVVARDIASGDLESRLDENLDKDLTDLTGSFNRMADTLQARIASEARFASDVSHELRTPITTVMTSLSVLEGRAEELSPAGREALELLGRDARRLERTLSDLVEIAKYDAGVVTPDTDFLPLPAVVSRALQRIGRSDLPVRIDQASSGALVEVDERRFERVLANLVENADSHGLGATQVSVRSKLGFVEISVEDDGPGIPDDELERIFERFARGANSRPQGRHSGSGLGLALARENVEVQGGRIWAENIPGSGARFLIEIPTEGAR